MTFSLSAPLFVEVAVPLPIDHPFTYRVPFGEEHRARVGVRVLIPFGGRKMTGLVTAITDASALGGRDAKDLLAILDEAPYVSERHLAFLSATARECLAPLGETLRAALPRGLPRKGAAAPRMEVFYRLPPFPPEGPMTPKQRLVFEAVREAGGLSSSDLTLRVPGGAAAAKRLAAKGFLLVASRPRPVSLHAASLPDLAGDLSPTPGQEAALARIGVAVASGRHAAFVLHGVTGSGKTEVYLRAVEQVRATGRQAIFLVPEIALTPQLLGRVRSRFRDGVAVLHSGLTPAERSSQWRKIRDGEVFLCVGARSAIFSPFPSVGLVVVDEEHDAAYKQEDGVRYQARDLALLRGRMEDAVVLLGSATPSAESFHRVRTGAATLLSLPERVGGSGMPEISVVDLKGRTDRRGADRYFSSELEAAIDATLARGEKAMLFLNRRGFASALTCLECGTTVQCRNCQVALTYHREHEALLCHYCNVKRKEPESCAKCGGHKLAQAGIGTERLLSWVSKRWKEARVARLDSDVTRKRGAFAEVLSGMHRGEVDILIGTQMIAKGHDFPEVTFVGVLLADLSLSFPDFRASERTFQILTQVAGRSGRGDRPGKVLFQTMAPESPAIRKAAEHDYAGFMEDELAARETMGYPPFGRMLLLRLSGARQDAAREAADLVAGALSGPMAAHGVRLLGPAPSPIARVKRRFLFQVLLVMPPDLPVGDLFPELLRPLRERVRKSGVRLEVDVDPYQMMV
ncbi:replication restart helicase PriA [Candidatus Deferrimicrobium sp.]|uniref:replication restart helicase PriA n=1 Tax=Candidatus Deferrimicrobium sp. TaxID=3060586 RepID=UPI003C5E976E